MLQFLNPAYFNPFTQKKLLILGLPCWQTRSHRLYDVMLICYESYVFAHAVYELFILPFWNIIWFMSNLNAATIICDWCYLLFAHKPSYQVILQVKNCSVSRWQNKCLVILPRKILEGSVGWLSCDLCLFYFVLDNLVRISKILMRVSVKFS